MSSTILWVLKQPIIWGFFFDYKKVDESMPFHKRGSVCMKMLTEENDACIIGIWISSY